MQTSNEGCYFQDEHIYNNHWTGTPDTQSSAHHSADLTRVTQNTGNSQTDGEPQFEHGCI